MNNKIEVWRPKINIPKSLKNSLSNLKVRNVRIQGGVDPIDINGLNAFFTDGICEWHDDCHIDNNYSLLLVVKNDTFSWVESKGVEVVKDQPVGTMIFLNIWEEHRLWNDNIDELGIYVVLVLDLFKKPASKKECEVLMRDYIENHYIMA